MMSKSLLVVLVLTVIIQQATACNSWTRWYNRDTPGMSGEYESLPTLRAENPGQICDHPSAFEAILLDGRPYTEGGDDLIVNTVDGLRCVNNEQADGRCEDYTIRFCCENFAEIQVTTPVPTCNQWTIWYNRDGPSGDGDFENHYLHRLAHPEICEHPSAIDAQLADGRPYQAGYDQVSIGPTVGLLCLNNNQPDGSCHDYKVRFCCT